MKLYTGDLSPYSAKVRMQIYAMGIRDDFEFDLPIALFFSGRFRQLSPIGRIPALEVQEGIIPESEVFAEYLDDLYPDRAMVGKTPFERANVRVLSRIADTYLMNNIFMSLGQLDPNSRSQAIVDLLMGQVKRGMGALEQHIGEDAYAAGASLTRADCTIVPALFLCESSVPRLGVSNPIEGHPKVTAYWARIKQNPHAAKIIEEMLRGLKARMDGSEKKMVEEALTNAKQT